MGTGEVHARPGNTGIITCSFVKDVWLVFSECYGQTAFGAGWAAQPVTHGGTRTQRELAFRLGANRCVLAYIRVRFGTAQSSQITGSTDRLREVQMAENPMPRSGVSSSRPAVPGARGGLGDRVVCETL